MYKTFFSSWEKRFDISFYILTVLKMQMYPMNKLIKHVHNFVQIKLVFKVILTSLLIFNVV